VNVHIPKKRRHVAATLGCCLLLAIMLAGGAPAASPAAGLPPQGVYEGCSPGTTEAHVQQCIERLRKIRAAGFVIVLNYSALYGSPEEVHAYAAAAGRLGIRLIWPIHHRDLYSKPDVSQTFIAMASACGCSSPHDLIPFMVRQVKDEPATFMYYVGDETPLEMHPGMAANSRLIQQTDPAHERFFVMDDYGSGAPWGTRLRPFADDADVIAHDTYPLGIPGRDVTDVGNSMNAVQQIADAHGRQAAMVLQAFSWGPDYGAQPERWPTLGEYRAMRDLALLNGRPRFILWWAAYVIFRSNDPERRWSDLVAAAMAPAPARPRAPAPAPPDAAPALPSVRRGSATRHGRVVRVRFALTRAAPTSVTVRFGRRRRERTVLGRVTPRTVAERVARKARCVSVTVTPAGGRRVRLSVRRARAGARWPRAAAWRPPACRRRPGSRSRAGRRAR
jgi:hypothetical protein